MLRTKLTAFALVTLLLPSANAAKWVEGKDVHVSTTINNPFTPDTSGAISIVGYETEGIPVPESDLFSIDVTVPEGVGSFMLEPENFRYDGRYWYSELTQTKDGVKFPLKYYIRVDGLSGMLDKNSVVYRSPGEKIKFYGEYAPDNVSTTSGYPWGTYSGTVKITWYSR